MSPPTLRKWIEGGRPARAGFCEGKRQRPDRLSRMRAICSDVSIHRRPTEELQWPRSAAQLVAGGPATRIANSSDCQARNADDRAGLVIAKGRRQLGVSSPCPPRLASRLAPRIARPGHQPSRPVAAGVSPSRCSARHVRCCPMALVVGLVDLADSRQHARSSICRAEDSPDARRPRDPVSRVPAEVRSVIDACPRRPRRPATTSLRRPISRLTRSSGFVLLRFIVFGAPPNAQA
jgi:hypothetical protein